MLEDQRGSLAHRVPASMRRGRRESSRGTIELPTLARLPAAPGELAHGAADAAHPVQYLVTRYCGRLFSEADITLIRVLLEQCPQASRPELSRQVCRALSWLKPDGGLKDMSCRVAMLPMHRDGLIGLPASPTPQPPNLPPRTHPTPPPH